MSRVLGGLLAAVAAAAGCTSPPEAGRAAAALVGARPIDATAGLSVFRPSPDGRFVPYGTSCQLEPQPTTPLLRLYDSWTGAIREVQTDACAAVGFFSPDGRLFAFPTRDGLLHVYSFDLDRTIIASRPGSRVSGVAFSPDSKWFVVAGSTFDATGSRTALDDWQADLVTRVEVAKNGYVSPFGPSGLVFSPDGGRMLFLADPSTPFPVGTLTLWDHRAGIATVLGAGVPLLGYAASPEWSRVALLRGVVPDPTQPLSQWRRGALSLVDLERHRAEVIATSSSALSPSFVDEDRLLYFDGPPQAFTGVSFAVRVISRHRTFVLAQDAFDQIGFPNLSSAVVRPDGKQVAFFAGGSPSRLTLDVRVAALPDATTTTAPTARAITHQAALVMPFGYVAGGSAIAFARSDTPTVSRGPDFTWSSWETASGVLTDVAAHVMGSPSPLGRLALVVPLLVQSLDAGGPPPGAADLRAWDPFTGAVKSIGHDIYAPSFASDPSGLFVGFLELGPDATGQLRPSTVRAGFTVGPLPTRTVAAEGESFAIVGLGRIVYATPAGLFDAYVF